MPAPVIIVTGANGQLGRELRDLAILYPQFHFIFLAKEDLPIHQFEQVQSYFKKVKPAFCINCAAYTAVDKAETDKDASMVTNGDATGVLAEVCTSLNTKFIHISTDYVFDGTAILPYKEDDATSPVNYYGSTKLKGEELAMQHNSESIIIRTSWVYSQYGNNFVKTMMRLMKERESLNVVSDQVGSPTYAADLAKGILDIIAGSEQVAGKWVPGIYHYSNEGIISWYDFAVAIKVLTGSNCIVNPIPATAYPTPAKRPAYSAFNKDKIKSTYHLTIEDWKTSLSAAINRLMQ
jgi:dTDP-4-dehydrorhamnose reductase